MSLSKESRQRFREILKGMRRELLGELKAQYQLTRKKDYEGDSSDHATSNTTVEFAHMFSERLRQRVLLIDNALDAIESGDYGLCEECEEPINEKRMELMPFVRFCVRCQSEMELQAKMRGESFGASGVMD